MLCAPDNAASVIPQDWPLRAHSRLIRSRPHLWHVQEYGDGPCLLFLHGAGGTTHSWRDVLPGLKGFHGVAIDLPGHGFTKLGSRHRSSLECIATDILALIRQEGWPIAGIVGHSAGAAIALRLSQLLPDHPPVLAINPALQPFQGLAGVVFPIAARAIATLPFAVDLIQKTLVAPNRTSQLLAGTGSRIDARGVALYERLLRDRNHVEGTLLMMAQWSLTGLMADLPRIETRALFLTGSNDQTVPPVTAVDAAHQMPNARVESLDGLGHLAHEEQPETLVARIESFFASAD